MPRGSAFESHQPWCGKPNDKRVYMSYVPQVLRIRSRRPSRRDALHAAYRKAVWLLWPLQ